MLGTLLRVHGPLRRSAQHVLVRSNHTPSAYAIDQLEKDSVRILRAVQKRVETRKELLSKASRPRSRRFGHDSHTEKRCRMSCRLRKTLRARVTPRNWSLYTTRGRRG